MENTYERVTEVLGKSPGDSICNLFIIDLGEKPQSAGCVFLSPNSGLTLLCGNGLILGVEFYSVLSGQPPHWFNSYKGHLPGNIRWEDCGEDIEQKLGGKPIESFLASLPNSYNHAHYAFPPHIVIVKSHNLTKKIFSITIGLKTKPLEADSEQINAPFVQTASKSPRGNKRTHRHKRG